MFSQFLGFASKTQVHLLATMFVGNWSMPNHMGMISKDSIKSRDHIGVLVPQATASSLFLIGVAVNQSQFEKPIKEHINIPNTDADLSLKKRTL